MLEDALHLTCEQHRHLVEGSGIASELGFWGMIFCYPATSDFTKKIHVSCIILHAYKALIFVCLPICNLTNISSFLSSFSLYSWEHCTLWVCLPARPPHQVSFHHSRAYFMDFITLSQKCECVCVCVNTVCIGACIKALDWASCWIRYHSLYLVEVLKWIGNRLYEARLPHWNQYKLNSCRWVVYLPRQCYNRRFYSSFPMDPSI